MRFFHIVCMFYIPRVDGVTIFNPNITGVNDCLCWTRGKLFFSDHIVRVINGWSRFCACRCYICCIVHSLCLSWFCRAGLWHWLDCRNFFWVYNLTLWCHYGDNRDIRIKWCGWGFTTW